MTRPVREETSAGGVVFRTEKGIPRFLLIRDGYRNWGFPKGHVEQGEEPDAAAVREVGEETGLRDLVLVGPIETIDWSFRFRGDTIHKVCHFFLMESARTRTSPQRAEGITACRWTTYEEGIRLLSYANARQVLRQAQVIIHARSASPARREETRERSTR